MFAENVIKTLPTRYCIDNITAIIRLRQGFSNENFKIVTNKGSFLLRFYKHLPTESVKMEHLMLSILEKTNFPSAYPLKDKWGSTFHMVNNVPVALFPFLNGSTPPKNTKVAKQIAYYLGLLHQTDTNFIPLKKNNLRPETINALVHKFPFANQWAHNPAPNVFQDFIRIWNKVKPFITQNLPTGLIHGDLFPDNTLFSKNQLVAIIDFEEFCIDTLLFDVAMTMNGFCFIKNRPDRKLMISFLNSYNNIRSLTSSEKKLLPQYILWTILAMVSWHLQNHLIFKPDKRQKKRVEELMDRAVFLENNLFLLKNNLEKG